MCMHARAYVRIWTFRCCLILQTNLVMLVKVYGLEVTCFASPSL